MSKGSVGGPLTLPSGPHPSPDLLYYLAHHFLSLSFPSISSPTSSIFLHLLVCALSSYFISQSLTPGAAISRHASLWPLRAVFQGGLPMSAV